MEIIKSELKELFVGKNVFEIYIENNDLQLSKIIDDQNLIADKYENEYKVKMLEYAEKLNSQQEALSDLMRLSESLLNDSSPKKR